MAKLFLCTSITGDAIIFHKNMFVVKFYIKKRLMEMNTPQHPEPNDQLVKTLSKNKAYIFCIKYLL